MKKLIAKIEFLVDLCQQIHSFLKAAPEIFKTLAAPQIEFLSQEQFAKKCMVTTRQVRRWVYDNKIIPAAYIGSSPFYSVRDIEEAMASGKLSGRQKG